MCRRICAKYHSCYQQVQDLIDFYSYADFPGAIDEDKLVDGLPMLSAPPHGSPGRAAWKNGFHPLGPVGHMCYSAAQYRMCIVIKEMKLLSTFVFVRFSF